MTLHDDIRQALRVTSDAFDDEIDMLINAALYDMRRVGVNPDLLDPDGTESEDPACAYVRQAVVCYAKAHFGYDNPEATRFEDSYTRIVIDLMNSSENIAAMKGGE